MDLKSSLSHENFGKTEVSVNLGRMESSHTREADYKFGKLSTLYVSPVLPGESRGDLLNVFLCNLLGFLQLGVYGELRTDQTAQATVNTVVGLKHYLRRMIALLVETLALLEATVRTELDAKTATLAPVPNDAHHAPRNRMGLRIQGQSPELHPDGLRYLGSKAHIV